MKKKSCKPINPKKYSCKGLKKIHTRNLITKKNSCSSKIPLPPITFLMVRPLARTKGLLCFIAGWTYDINHSSFTTQNLKGLHKDRESDGHRLIRKGGIFFLFFWCFLLLYISLNTFIHPYISLQYKTPAIFPWLNLEERKQKR